MCYSIVLYFTTLNSSTQYDVKSVSVYHIKLYCRISKRILTLLSACMHHTVSYKFPVIHKNCRRAMLTCMSLHACMHAGRQAGRHAFLGGTCFVTPRASAASIHLYLTGAVLLEQTAAGTALLPPCCRTVQGSQNEVATQTPNAAASRGSVAQ